MAKKPKASVSESSDSAGPDSGTVSVTHAPALYFEGVSTIGSRNGMINVTLVKTQPKSLRTGAASEVVAVVYLRCKLHVALELRKALETAILLGATNFDPTN